MRQGAENSSIRSHFVLASGTLVVHNLTIFRGAPETARSAETPPIRAFCCLSPCGEFAFEASSKK
jgi:hypothetical protein